MVVEANISRLDILKMQLRMMFRIRGNWYFFAFLWVLLAITAFGLAAEYGWVPYLLTVTAFAIPGFLITMAVCLLFNIAFASERQGVIGPHRFELRPDAFVEEACGTTTATEWSGVQRVYTFRDSLYVLISMYRMHVIPKSSFSTDDEFGAFAKELERHVASG